MKMLNLFAFASLFVRQFVRVRFNCIPLQFAAVVENSGNVHCYTVTLIENGTSFEILLGICNLFRKTMLE